MREQTNSVPQTHPPYPATSALLNPPFPPLLVPLSALPGATPVKSGKQEVVPVLAHGRHGWGTPLIRPAPLIAPKEEPKITVGPQNDEPKLVVTAKAKRVQERNERRRKRFKEEKELKENYEGIVKEVVSWLWSSLKTPTAREREISCGSTLPSVQEVRARMMQLVSSSQSHRKEESGRGDESVSPKEKEKLQELLREKQVVDTKERELEKRQEKLDQKEQEIVQKENDMKTRESESEKEKTKLLHEIQKLKDEAEAAEFESRRVKRKMDKQRSAIESLKERQIRMEREEAKRNKETNEMREKLNGALKKNEKLIEDKEKLFSELGGMRGELEKNLVEGVASSTKKVLEQLDLKNSNSRPHGIEKEGKLLENLCRGGRGARKARDTHGVTRIGSGGNAGVYVTTNNDNFCFKVAGLREMLSGYIETESNVGLKVLREELPNLLPVFPLYTLRPIGFVMERMSMDLQQFCQLVHVQRWLLYHSKYGGRVQNYEVARRKFRERTLDKDERIVDLVRLWAYHSLRPECRTSDLRVSKYPFLNVEYAFLDLSKQMFTSTHSLATGNIVHNDIKLANILLEPSFQGVMILTAKANMKIFLGDYGSAQIVAKGDCGYKVESLDDAPRTTPVNISPESLSTWKNFSGKVTFLSDVWSMGIAVVDAWLHVFGPLPGIDNDPFTPIRLPWHSDRVWAGPRGGMIDSSWASAVESNIKSVPFYDNSPRHTFFANHLNAIPAFWGLYTSPNDRKKVQITRARQLVKAVLSCALVVRPESRKSADYTVSMLKKIEQQWKNSHVPLTYGDIAPGKRVRSSTEPYNVIDLEDDPQPPSRKRFFG